MLSYRNLMGLLSYVTPLRTDVNAVYILIPACTSLKNVLVPWILGSSRCSTVAGLVAGVQRQMDGWGRHDAIVWLCYFSDIVPEEQLWWVMYQCITCCPRYRQVWEEIPEETIHWHIMELTLTDLYSILIMLEWCRMLCLTSYLHLKNDAEGAKIGMVIIYPYWGIWIKGPEQDRVVDGDEAQRTEPCCHFFRRMASHSVRTAPLWAPLSQ